MALRLEIISPHRQKLGARGSIVLGVAGGSIGRALDNDWALPDSHRFLSGHHARVHFRAGHYIIEDTSSNGVFYMLSDQLQSVSRILNRNNTVATTQIANARRTRPRRPGCRR